MVLRLVFLFSAGLGACTSGRQDVTAAALTPARLPDLSSARLVELREHSVKGLRVKEFTGTGAGAELRVSRLEDVDEAAAARVLQQKRLQMEALGVEQRSPYPGEISAKVKCAGTFLPVLRDLQGEGFSGLRVEAAANARKNIGVCGEAEFSFHAVLVHLYCRKARVLLQIESFLPRSAATQPKAWLSDVSCTE